MISDLILDADDIQELRAAGYLKAVPGWGGFYSVTQDGQVFSEPRQAPNKRVAGKWLTPFRSTRFGHLQCTFCRQGKQIKRSVHSLVLETFRGPRPAGMEACHSPNRDPADNRLDNLCWGTRRRNQLDAVKDGTSPGFVARGEHSGRSKFKERDIREAIRLRAQECLSVSQIATRLGMSKSLVQSILHRRTWKCLWQKIDDERAAATAVDAA